MGVGTVGLVSSDTRVGVLLSPPSLHPRLSYKRMMGPTGTHGTMAMQRLY